MIPHLTHIMNLANSIIGVSVLAMPFCFKQCGIILAGLILLICSLLSRLACHFLVKSAVMSRRRNFELLAFHSFGQMGKFLVELFIIGFLIGTCIAFFVVVGDLGPQILGKIIDREPGEIRTSLLITTATFIILPLGLLRNIDSLSSVSIATIGFYLCLVLKVMAESTQQMFTGEWMDRVYYWRPAGILQCLPIFSMALFCQTQLFEIYEVIPNVTLEKMNHVVRGALNICTAVYLCVGFFGYVAFCTQSFTGNILMSFQPTLTSEIIKMGFVFSVAFSFPLVIFPCRASLNSLLFRRGYTHESSSNYIPEMRFRCLTFAIVMVSLITGILIPNIEFVLGLVGSTIGVIICLIFPATFFLSISSKNTNERMFAQAIVFIGFWIMILGTYANLYAMEESSNAKIAMTTHKSHPLNNLPLHLQNQEIPGIMNLPTISEVIPNIKETLDSPDRKMPLKRIEEIRREPLVPVERTVVTEKTLEAVKKESLVPTSNPENHRVMDENLNIEQKKEEPDRILQEKVEEPKQILKGDSLIHSDAIKREESELAAAGELANIETAERHEELRKTLEKHKLEQLEMIQEQLEIVQEQKKLLENMRKEKQELSKRSEVKHEEESSKNREDDKDLVVANFQSNKTQTNNEVQPENNVEEIDKKREEIVLQENQIANLGETNEIGSKFRGPILTALSKQEIPVNESGANDVNKKKSRDLDAGKRIQEQFSLPIALKMRNQTEANKNPSKNEVDAIAQRDLLETQQRDKREITVQEEKESDNNVNINVSNNNNNNNNTVESETIVNMTSLEKTKDNCKREEGGEEERKKSQFAKDVQENIVPSELIKTNVYLLAQSFTDKMTIDSSNGINAEFIKVKQRDLKAVGN